MVARPRAPLPRRQKLAPRPDFRRSPLNPPSLPPFSPLAISALPFAALYIQLHAASQTQEVRRQQHTRCGSSVDQALTSAPRVSATSAPKPSASSTPRETHTKHKKAPKHITDDERDERHASKGKQRARTPSPQGQRKRPKVSVAQGQCATGHIHHQQKCILVRNRSPKRGSNPHSEDPRGSIRRHL